MRKREKTVLWPSYVDSTKTRREGRRVLRSEGVPNPTLAELLSAAEKLSLKPEAEADAAHPACAWRKTGRIVVEKKGIKPQIVAMIAKEIATVRQRAKK